MALQGLTLRSTFGSFVAPSSVEKVRLVRDLGRVSPQRGAAKPASCQER